MYKKHARWVATVCDKAVNQSLTVRNWLIGLYIVEFEQRGEDRAKYGERLLTDLSASDGVKGLSERT